MKFILKNESLVKYLDSRHDGDSCTIQVMPLIDTRARLHCLVYNKLGHLIATETVDNIVIEAVPE